MLFFKTKQNYIILCQQLSSWDKTFCVGWPLGNLYEMEVNNLFGPIGSQASVTQLVLIESLHNVCS